jgi:hypothetical protein
MTRRRHGDDDGHAPASRAPATTQCTPAATRGHACDKDGDGDRTPFSMTMTAMTQPAMTWPVTTDGSCVEGYPEPLRAPGLRTLDSDVDDRDCRRCDTFCHCLREPPRGVDTDDGGRVVGIRCPRYVLTHFSKEPDTRYFGSHASYRLRTAHKCSIRFHDPLTTTMIIVAYKWRGREIQRVIESEERAIEMLSSNRQGTEVLAGSACVK